MFWGPLGVNHRNFAQSSHRGCRRQAASPPGRHAQVPAAPGENAHAYGVGEMIDLSCDEFMSICEACRARAASPPGRHAHSYGVGEMIDLSCDKFMSICGLWPLDIWPAGHSICKAPLRSPCSICATLWHVVDRQHKEKDISAFQLSFPLKICPRTRFPISS